MAKKKYMLCPHNKCDGEAKLEVVLSGREWWRCQKCRFAFPNMDTGGKPIARAGESDDTADAL